MVSPDGTNFEDFLKEQLKNPKFKKEWDKLELEYSIIGVLLEFRAQNNMTQKKLAKKSGVKKSDINKLETGDLNVSIRTLRRIAKAMGKTLEIKFV